MRARTALVRALARAVLLLFPGRFRRTHRGDFVEAATHILRRESSRSTATHAVLITSRVVLVDSLTSAAAMWMTTADSPDSPSMKERLMHRPGQWFRGTRHDLFVAARFAIRRPALTAAIVGTLALGIGVSTAVFDALDRAILHPLPFARSHELAFLVMREVTHDSIIAVPLPTFQNWRARATTVRSIEVFRRQNVIENTATGAETRNGLGISGGLPGMLGVRPLLGRMITPADATATAAAVVMLGEARWRGAFGADPNVIGRTITLGGTPAEIVGVWPSGARLDFEEAPELIRPLPAGKEYRDGAWVQVIGRIQPGRTKAEAVNELNMLVVPREGNQISQATYRPALIAPADLLLGPEFVTGVWLVFGGGLLLLAAALANASHLMLERATERAHELGVRRALGASRARLVRMLFAEAIVFATLSLGVSALIALGIEGALTHYEPRLFVEAAGAGLGGRAFLFGAAVAVAASLICTLAAMTSVGRHRLAMAGTARVTSGAAPVVATLVATQAAMAIGLACGAVLMAQSLRHLSRVDPGLDVNHLAELSVSLPAARYPTPASQNAYRSRVLDELRAVPGIVGATTANMPLMLASEMNGIPRLDNEPEVTMASAPLMALVSAPRDYLELVGIPLRGGRLYDANEKDVAVVSESFARSHGGAIIGRSLYLPNSTKPATIVGIVGDVRYSGLADDESRMPALYFSSTPTGGSFIRFFIRAARSPADALSAARQRIAAVDPNVPVLGPDTGPDVIGRQTARHRFVAMLLGSLSACGFLLAMSGVYGAVALSIARRRREIGVRMALGATADRLVAAFVARGLRPVVMGTAVGVAAVWFATPFLQALLFRVSAHDPTTGAAGTGLVLVTALMAAFIPARRISQIDPARTLRES